MNHIILNPTLWARALLVAAALTLLPIACTYRSGEPKTGEWCLVSVARRLPLINVRNPADTLWQDVLVNITMPCDSVPPGVERRPK